MTEAEKIEKLAKWMGWDKWSSSPDYPSRWREAVGSGRYNLHKLCDHWNPFENIADAWMLVEKMRNECISNTPPLYSWAQFEDYVGESMFLTNTAPQAARAISEAVLEVIDSA